MKLFRKLLCFLFGHRIDHAIILVQPRNVHTLKPEIYSGYCFCRRCRGAESSVLKPDPYEYLVNVLEYDGTYRIDYRLKGIYEKKGGIKC
jgi:hypothetical protein